MTEKLKLYAALGISALQLQLHTAGEIQHQTSFVRPLICRDPSEVGIQELPDHQRRVVMASLRLLQKLEGTRHRIEGQHYSSEV